MRTESYEGCTKREFLLYGRKTIIVEPEHALPGKPWVWRTEFFGAFPSADNALLKMGFHLAYHSASDMYGCPEAIAMLEHFREWFCDTWKMSPRPVLFGFSRGGLYAVNYALAHPKHTGSLYLDAPVLDFRSWPGKNPLYAREWQECLASYRMTEEEARAYRGTPLDRADELAALGIPTLIVAGEADTVVPCAENTDAFERAYRAAGGTALSTIRKPHCDHHPHSLEDPAPITTWILRALGIPAPDDKK